MRGGGVDDYEDRLGGGNPCEVAGEEVGDDFFIGADGVQGVGAGEVFQNNVGANVSLCVGDGDSGVVTGFGVEASEFVEDGGFAGVRGANEDDTGGGGGGSVVIPFGEGYTTPFFPVEFCMCAGIRIVAAGHDSSFFILCGVVPSTGC